MQQTVADFFDPNNIEHLKAYRELQTNGAWPKEFFEQIKDLDFQHGGWSVGIPNKMADQYINYRLDYQPLRFELDMFAHVMEAKLKHSDTEKGDSWKTCDNSFLIGKFFEELQEWCDKF